jgi:hypothetical protein
MKKFTILSLLFLVSGCTNLTSSSTNLPTQQEQLCRELKRGIIFNTTSGPNFDATSTAQKTNMMRLYDKYNCGQLEKILES